MAQGAPTTAVTLLRRALDEPPPRGELGGVLLELGMAELVSGDPDAAATGSAQAIEVLDDPLALAAAAQAQTLALIGQGRVEDAALTIERVRPAVAAHPVQLLTLDALQLAMSLAYISRDADRDQAAARLREALRSAPPERAETRGAKVLLAAVEAIAGAASAAVRERVDEAWGGERAAGRAGTRGRLLRVRRASRCASRESSARWSPSRRRSPIAPARTARCSACATPGCGVRSRARAWGA